MAGVYQQDTSHDAKLRATLEVTDKEGQLVRKRFTLSRVGSFGNGKTPDQSGKVGARVFSCRKERQRHLGYSPPFWT